MEKLYSKRCLSKIKSKNQEATRDYLLENLNTFIQYRIWLIKYGTGTSKYNFGWECSSVVEHLPNVQIPGFESQHHTHTHCEAQTTKKIDYKFLFHFNANYIMHKKK